MGKRTLLNRQSRIHLKQDILKTGAEVCAVDGGVPAALGVVEIFAFPAVELYALDVGEVGEAGGEERV